MPLGVGVGRRNNTVKLVYLGDGKPGGTMIGGPARGVIHETQTTTVPGYGGGTRAPHFTIDRDGTIYQHTDTYLAARALYNASGGVQTNRQGKYCLQVEVVAFSTTIGGDWTPEQVTALQQLVAIGAVSYDIKPEFPLEQGGGSQYGLNNPVEMSADEWVNFNAWCAHQHVPENTHWDVGNEPLGVVFDMFKEQTMLTPEEEQFVRSLKASVESVGSNPSFAKFAIEHLRKHNDEWAKKTHDHGTVTDHTHTGTFTTD